MKRIITMVLAVMLICMAGLGYAGEMGIQDLANARIGVTVGSVQAIELPKLLPDAVVTEYNTTTDAAMALSTGKIDAFSTENSVYLAMQREGLNFQRIAEPLLVSQYGMVFGKGANLQMQADFNQYLADCRADGSLAQLEARWFGNSEPDDILTCDGMTGEKGELHFVIESSQKPFSYVKNGSYAGFDVELMILFARAYGYQLVIENASFSGILTGVDQGRYDMAGSGITITEERSQSMDFSDPTHTDEIILVVPGAQSASDRPLSEFENATLGVIDGSLYDGYSRRLFPGAKIDSYPSFNDLFQCVKQGKIDGFLLDIPNFSAVARTDENLTYVNVPDCYVEIGIAFGKNETGEKLQREMNEFLETIRADGTYDSMWEYWCSDTEPADPPAVPEFAQDAVELDVVLDLSRKPYVYLLNNEYAGFEVELMYRFCQAYGYKPVFESAQWTSGVAGLKDGKYDVVSCGIYMTEERKESVNFCDPYVVADVILVTYERDDAAGTWESLKASFEKTFIREDRWKLIVEGTVNTLIISFFSALGGTALGFGIYLLARAKNRALSGITRGIARVYSRLIAGTPTLVVLMILFYVIFGKSDINGIIVAIIGFSITFSSFVYGHLRLCVNGIDRGQTEAAYALGYTRNQAFFKLILPQALRMFMPTYTGEIVGLIKATSVVGYIAVNDLTKMGDIIRSNTYEALFPLFAVAVIYFLVTWGIAALLGLVQKKMEPQHRSSKKILKGVAE